MKNSLISMTKKVTLIDIVKIYLYIIKLNLHKKKRDYSTIDQEYNLTIWNRKFEDIDFETKEGMYDRDDLNKYSIFLINDHLFKGKRIDYQKQFQNQIFDLLRNYAGDSIVELGCGLGANLFIMNNMGFTKLEGYDLSENAILNAKQYAKKKNYDIKFDILDLNKTIPNEKIKDKVVFTCACLEQLKNFMPNVLKNIIEGKPKLVINFEVDYNSASYMVRKYFDVRDYQNNLVDELRNLEKQKKIEIISIEKLPLALSPVNRLSAIIWKIKQ